MPALCQSQMGGFLSTAAAGPVIPNLTQRYAELPAKFYSRAQPVPVRRPQILLWNEELADDLGIAQQDAEVFGGNRVPAGGDPLAQVYTGHQFGQLAPRLGDGRASLMGSLFNHGTSQMNEIQLKGSGRTFFSRTGDGRGTLASMLREYILSEALHHLGIPTTRSLACTATNESVVRGEGPVPGGVLTRVARGFVRVGTFEYFATRHDLEAVQQLTQHVLDHYDFSDRAKASAAAFCEEVAQRQAHLVAGWLAVGFVHGVMNTDNTSIVGETIDYGPCAFLDVYAADAVFSSIDQHRRYAFGRQPCVAKWNVLKWLEAVYPALDQQHSSLPTFADLQLAVANAFDTAFQQAWQRQMTLKLGFEWRRPSDTALVQALLDLMEAKELDYTQTFRALADTGTLPTADEPDAADWLVAWRARRSEAGADVVDMRAHSPVYIARNHVVEAVVNSNDAAKAQRLVCCLRRPFTRQPGCDEFEQSPTAAEVVTKTFCGT
jgi:serine/tyrosine/threonine adenylyltransferase